MTTGCAVLVAVAVWRYGLPGRHPAHRGGATGAPPAAAQSAASARLLSPAAPAAATHADASGLATVWKFEPAIEGDRVPIRSVGQIPAGILVDATSGSVLWSKQHRAKKEIASMTKMMTTLLAVEAVSRKQMTLDQKITVSRTAAKTGGSQVYLKQGEIVTFGGLLKTVIIKSANDSAQLVAETVAGNEEAFVARMNERAKALGMTGTAFYNVHGLPEKNSNVSTALDMALLARELIKHPVVLTWSSTRRDTFRNDTFQLDNSNPLVGVVKGVDGLKTGYYRRAGFCITVTAERSGVRLIAVVIGVQKKSVRKAFCTELIEWGFRQAAVARAQNGAAPGVPPSHGVSPR